jgi:uncharacterized membrane protein YccF (DUF307 family)
MRTILNLIWFCCFGWISGLCWWFFGVLAALSIIGLPWAKACFVIGQFSFFPVGYEAIDREELTHQMDIGTSPLGSIGNILWFLFAGIWLAIGHLAASIPFFLSIIGIPFGIQHLKLAGIALAPIGKTIVPVEVAEAARKAEAEQEIIRLRR